MTALFRSFALLMLMVAAFGSHADARADATASFSLFGSPKCTEWTAMTPEQRVGWTRAYLSTISKAYLEIRGASDKKPRNPQDIDNAASAVDQYCAANPAAQAADGIAPFLQPK